MSTTLVAGIPTSSCAATPRRVSSISGRRERRRTSRPAGPAGRFLAAAHYAYVDLDLDGGMVALRCNGFLRDEAALDELAIQFSGIVAGVREACAPWFDPRPFEQEVVCDWITTKLPGSSSPFRSRRGSTGSMFRRASSTCAPRRGGKPGGRPRRSWG